MAKKFDGSRQRKAPGRPPIDAALEALVVRMAQEYRSWGYDALREYVMHYHAERPHQGKGNIVLFPGPRRGGRGDSLLQCRERLGRLLKYYAWEAA